MATGSSLRVKAGLWATAGALGLAAAMAVRAQAPPSSADPALTDKRFETPPVPAAQPGGATAPEVAVPAAPAAAGPSFTLREIRFEGATHFSPDALSLLAAPLVGPAVTLADLQQFAERLTLLYRRAGFVLSRAVVPEQAVSDGVVTVRVLEGYVANAAAQGLPRAAPLLEAMLAKLTAERPLRAATLERYVLLADDLPGVTARAVLSPSPAPAPAGASDLTLDVAEERWDALFRLDNRGNRYSGPLQAELGVGFNSLLRPFDRTHLRTVLAAHDFDELQLFSLDHEQPLNTEGTRLHLGGSLSWQEPGYLLGDVDTDSESSRLLLEVKHPFLRQRHRNLTGRVALAAFNIETEQLGTLVSRENLRSLRLGLTYDWADRWRGVNVVDIEVSQGMNILGARRSGAANLSRPNGKSDYTKVTVYASREQYLRGGWSVNGGLGGQYAFTQVLASEEFAYGGVPFGRAHDSAELSGDHGLAGSLELRYTRPAAWRWLQSWQAYAYCDAGGVWREDSTAREARDFASDAGLGLRCRFDALRAASIEVAKPLAQGVTAQGDDGGYGWRVFFSLAAGF